MPRKEFNKYRLNITQGLWSEGEILCYKDSVYQGAIYFLKDSEKEPVINSNGTLSLFYPIEKFDLILTACREESPIYLEIWGGADKYCRVTTDKEPVGEEEGN